MQNPESFENVTPQTLQRLQPLDQEINKKEYLLIKNVPYTLNLFYLSHFTPPQNPLSIIMQPLNQRYTVMFSQ